MSEGVRRAVVELYGDGRKLDGTLATSQAKVRKWGQKVSRDIRGAMRGAFDGVKGIAGFAGVAGIAAATQHVIEFEERLARLGVASRSTAAGMANLKGQLFAVAQSTGVQASELLTGVERFVSLTGNVGAAEASLKQFAEISMATGAGMSDIADTAAALFTNMKIGPGQMKEAFGVMIEQGKAGAVELKDLSTLAAGLTPQFSTFANKGVPALAEMGAAMQIMRSGFGSSSEAATGLTSLMTAMVKNSGKLAKAGVKVFEVGPDGVKRARAFSDIAFDIADAFKGKDKELIDVLGRGEAYQAMLPLIKAGRHEFELMVAAGSDGAKQIDADFARMAESPGFKMKQAKATIDKTFNDLLAKNLTSIAAGFTAIAKAIQFIVDNKLALASAFALLKGGGYVRALALGGASAGMGGRAGGGLSTGAANAGLVGFASKLGLATQALGLGVVAITAFFDYLNDKIDEKEQKLTSDLNTAHYGQFGLERAEEVLAGKGEASMFYPGSEEERQSKAASARQYLLNEAMRAGKIKRGEGGKYEQVSQKGGLVGHDANLSYDQIVAIGKATKAAMDQTNAEIAAGDHAGAPVRPGGSVPVIRIEVGVDPVTGNLTAEDAMKKLTAKRKKGKR